jgi:hypothetical protein
LRKHNEAYLEHKKQLKKKKCQDWYCKNQQWITDFDALSLNKDDTRRSAQQQSLNQSASQMSSSSSNSVEFIVPADEHFTRCPISKEVFATLWDEEEAEMMFSNAVKVLVTESSDPNVFKVAKPVHIDDDDNPDNLDLSGVRYLIVNKSLVLDPWLKDGKAICLKEAIMRFEFMEEGRTTADLLRVAAGEDDEEDNELDDEPSSDEDEHKIVPESPTTNRGRNRGKK